MKRVLQRIWVGIVGATAGASVGLVAAVILAFQQVDLNKSLWVVAVCIGVGFVLGLALGNRRLG
jgi:TRAP-type mannitol/chloroaromatic compound transport system permease large subunit